MESLKKEDKVPVNLDTGNRGKTSWTRTMVFLITFFVIAAFMLQSSMGLFVDPNVEFNEVDSVAPEMKKKTKTVKTFDLSVFSSDKYNELNKDEWHQYNRDELEIGNESPFLDPGIEE